MSLGYILLGISAVGLVIVAAIEGRRQRLKDKEEEE